MTQDDWKQHSDDIARLKQRLGDEHMPYQDISREAALLAACRRWPLLAESEGWATASAGPETAAQDQALRP